MDRLTLILGVLMSALGALVWTAIARRLVAGLPVLPLAVRRPVPWRGVDLLMVSVYFLLASLACGWVFSLLIFPDRRADRCLASREAAHAEQALDLMVSLAANVAANLTTAAFALLWISSSAAATAEDFGWRRDKLVEDLRVGLIAFAAIAAPVYGLQALLSQFVKEQHPIIEVLKEHPSPTLYALAGLSAVAVAPLAEEFFFRVLLQGWLESVRWPGEPPRGDTETISEHRPRPIAIVITSLLFAALHLGHGAAPVPLFLLSLALGYLYQRTHRLLPCATVHFCLNACSFIMLYFSPAE